MFILYTMKDFRQRKKKTLSLYSPLVLVLLFLLLLLLLKSVYSSYSKKERAQTEQQKIDLHHSELLDRVENLSKKIKKLRTEEGIKEELKKNNNVGEKGETILRIVESRN